MSGRANKRNNQGGKAFKSQAKGGVNFRTQAAEAAATDLLSFIQAHDTGYKGMTPAQKAEAEAALLELQVGRIVQKMGNGRFMVTCQDGMNRNCALRGLLRRKNKCFVELGSLVVVSLTEPLEELDDSDDDGNFGTGKQREGAEHRKQTNLGYIAGIFDGRTAAQLQKTRINPKLFKVIDVATGAEVEDIFDRSEAVAGGGGADDEAVAPKKKKRSDNDEVKLEDL